MIRAKTNATESVQQQQDATRPTSDYAPTSRGRSPASNGGNPYKAATALRCHVRSRQRKTSSAANLGRPDGKQRSERFLSGFPGSERGARSAVRDVTLCCASCPRARSRRWRCRTAVRRPRSGTSCIATSGEGYRAAPVSRTRHRRLDLHRTSHQCRLAACMSRRHLSRQAGSPRRRDSCRDHRGHGRRAGPDQHARRSSDRMADRCVVVVVGQSLRAASMH